MFYRNPSADMLLTPGELNLDIIRSAKIFHYGSTSLIMEPCRSAHLKAMEVAREAVALLSYDPNLRLPLWPSAEEAREQIRSIWDQADIVKQSVSGRRPPLTGFVVGWKAGNIVLRRNSVVDVGSKAGVGLPLRSRNV
uniref:Carbohydrate kinase PfkB domain-containing protein n=1 Tax=Kalanchoe fedtschenkoi TaxID=63787 RepID=A0A7N1A1S1_KALFE